MDSRFEGIDPYDDFDLLERFGNIFELDGDHRIVLEFTLGGDSVEDIAEIHGISKRRVHRCLKDIRLRMGVKDKRKFRTKFMKFAANQCPPGPKHLAS